MDNGELLEAAAKAARIDRLDFGDGVILTNDAEGHTVIWNPRDCDGQAMRLAVVLSIDVLQRQTEPPEVWAQAPMQRTVIEPAGNDRAAATRLAILRAAAEIGQSIP